MAEPYDILVAGGGPAGITAAIYAARSGLRTLLIEIPGEEPGAGAESIWPGEAYIAEADLVQRLREHAHQVGVECVDAAVGALDLAARNRAVVTEAGVRYEARAVILCSRSLPLEQAPGVFAAGPARRLAFPEAIVLAGDGAAAALAAVRYLAEEEYLRRELVEPPEPVLAVFWSEEVPRSLEVLQWAEACTGQTAGVIRLARIDCTHNTHLGERYGVSQLPAVLLFRQGRVIDRLEGNFAEFSHWLTEWTTLAAR